MHDSFYAVCSVEDAKDCDCMTPGKSGSGGGDDDDDDDDARDKRQAHDDYPPIDYQDVRDDEYRGVDEFFLPIFSIPHKKLLAGAISTIYFCNLCVQHLDKL